jgi:hypothetical protein
MCAGVRGLDLAAIALMRLASLGLLLLSAACGAVDGRSEDAGRDAGGSDAGQRDAGTDAGTQQNPDAGTTPFCGACVTSTECGPGSLCLGGLEARCGRDCSTSTTCAEGAACVSIGLGKGPRLGSQCLAADTPSCGAFTRKPGLDCSDTWAGYAQNFFGTTCIGACHRHDGTWTTLSDVRSAAESIRLAVETGSMPTDQTLTAAERLRLLTWLACGAN